MTGSSSQFLPFPCGGPHREHWENGKKVVLYSQRTVATAVQAMWQYCARKINEISATIQQNSF